MQVLVKFLLNGFFDKRIIDKRIKELVTWNIDSTLNKTFAQRFLMGEINFWFVFQK